MSPHSVPLGQGLGSGEEMHNTGSQPSSKLNETPVENFRPMRVIVIGAGYSGIYCGIRIPERLRNVELCIYDKNADIGGTWYENRCDLSWSPFTTPEALMDSTIDIPVVHATFLVGRFPSPRNLTC